MEISGFPSHSFKWIKYHLNSNRFSGKFNDCAGIVFGGLENCQFEVISWDVLRGEDLENLLRHKMSWMTQQFTSNIDLPYKFGANRPVCDIRSLELTLLVQNFSTKHVNRLLSALLFKDLTILIPGMHQTSISTSRFHH